jgi:hypothetical protein
MAQIHINPDNQAPETIQMTVTDHAFDFFSRQTDGQGHGL